MFNLIFLEINHDSVRKENSQFQKIMNRSFWSRRILKDLVEKDKSGLVANNVENFLLRIALF